MPRPSPAPSATPTRPRLPRAVLGGALTAAAVVAGAVGLTATVGSPRSTTPLDGQDALPAQVVAGRVISRYHALPWLGRAVVDADCAQDLAARAGATTTCTLVDEDGGEVVVAVRALSVDRGALTWEFDR